MTNAKNAGAARKKAAKAQLEQIKFQLDQLINRVNQPQPTKTND